MRFSAILILSLFTPALYAADKIEFNREIRPILSEHCFACHGPDKNKRKADLRLDDRSIAIAKEAIVPGQAAKSELVKRITKKSEESVMPPLEFHKPLKFEQIELLKKWIDQGAEYQPHWAYINPTRPAVPAAKKPGWDRNPIDAFILAALEAKKMSPSPETDKQRLIRRVTLDLIGLPPTPEEVDAFVNDQSPDAYEKLVDSLLASKHFGERMAVPWLDLVRFADTVGYHGDQNQRIFPYRDYVIDSFNKNKPFDQFTREQLAGDLLPNPTTEQLIASGFNRLNMMTREGGAQAKEYLAKYQADRVRTTSITWLGSTFGCAECHDHKYDPIKAKDFYSMAAFFADLKQWGVYSDYGYSPNPELKGWTNDYPFPPEIEVPNEYLLARQKHLQQELERIAKDAYKEVTQNPESAKAYAKWSAMVLAQRSGDNSYWNAPKAGIEKDGQVEKGSQVVFTGKAVKGSSLSFTLEPVAGWFSSVKLELLPHEKHNGKITRDAAMSTTVQLVLALKRGNGKEAPLKLFQGEADKFEPLRYDSTQPVFGLDAGSWKTDSRQADQPHSAVFQLDKPFELKKGDKIVVTLKSDNVGCARVSLSPQAELDTPMFKPDEQLAFGYLPSTGIPSEKLTEYRKIRKEIESLNHGKAWTQVSVSTKPMETRILPRGNFLDETGPIVEPAVPGFLSQSQKAAGKRLTRLDLADWIVSKENPLTARVFVNRLWKQFFGTGLSAIMEDVGGQGEWPSHPELLDWLAVEFRDSGWNVKKMVKEIVTSATYKQDSKARLEYREIDPSNRLLSYHPPRRLEAEFVRDNALAIAGLLNGDIGGPSVKPYQPDGYYANIQFPNRKYVADTDEREYRRGLYMHWQRTFLHPMLANFDAPSREECTAARNLANTPQQALTLLNSPIFVEAARVLASHVVHSPARDDASRLDFLYRRALSRSASAKERDSLLKYLGEQRKYFESNTSEAKALIQAGLAPVDEKADPATLAAWTSVCRVVLNLHETITRY